jgi:hypothetical protein
MTIVRIERSPAIPDRPEDLTAEWLTHALSLSHPGLSVSRVGILDQHSGTTGRVRLSVEYGQGTSGPPSVFVKLPPFDESQRQLVAVTDMGRREARFYEGPAREAPLPLPQPYFAAHGDEPTQYIMVLEDLAAAGCTFSTRLEPHAEDHGRKIIDSLAHLHAHFWNDSRFETEFAWLQPAMRGAYGAVLIDSARQQFGDQLPPVFTELCRLYVEHHERINQVLDEGEQTLIHGDTHAGNQYSRGAVVGLYDWAVVSRSPGIRDVAIYLGNSCPTDIRRSEQERWIRSYHQILVDSGVGAPSFETLWERYRRSVIYAWVAATTTASMGSKWQPIEVGMLGMTRATDTCADLETIDALRAAI